MHLCQVARGSADGYCIMGIHCWDYAAGELIVREAGGFTMDTKGWSLPCVVADIVCLFEISLAGWEGCSLVVVRVRATQVTAHTCTIRYWFWVANFTHDNQAANLKRFFASVNPRSEGGILDFIDRIPYFMKDFSSATFYCGT